MAAVWRMDQRKAKWKQRGCVLPVWTDDKVATQPYSSLAVSVSSYCGSSQQGPVCLSPAPWARTGHTCFGHSDAVGVMVFHSTPGPPEALRTSICSLEPPSPSREQAQALLMGVGSHGAADCRHTRDPSPTQASLAWLSRII